MTAAENKSIPARGDDLFVFKANGARFYPQAGARLSYASLAASELFLPGLPEGMLKTGDEITVSFAGKTVYRGEVEKFSVRRARGLVTADATALDGFAQLERRIYRQSFKAGAKDSEAAIEQMSARVVLNRDAFDRAVSVADQAKECCEAGGVSVSDGGLPAVCLPADETRNVTCADALRRTLRFFPRVVSRFDYASGALRLSPAATAEAAWIASAKILSRTDTHTARPILGVDIATKDDDIEITKADGTTFSSRAFTHQTAGDCSGEDSTLYVYIPLAGGSSSTSSETIEVVTEKMPALLNAAFWKKKHPRLANVAQGAITITEAGRSSTKYDYMTPNDAGDLTAFGLNAEVVHCHCKARVETEDDVEEELYLTMDFTMTDASAGSHTRQTGSSSVAAETLPDGLAEAILAQRGGALEAVEIAMRVESGAWPQVGDVCGGLVCQAVEIDCERLVATCRFGRPAFLAPEDLKDLLNGFRARGSASNVPLRGSEEPEGEDGLALGPNGVEPLATTEFAPGTKAKTTIKGAGGSIVLDSSEVKGGGTLAVRTMKTTDKDGAEKEVQVLASEDLDGLGGGVTSLNGLAGAVSLRGGEGIEVSESGQTITISYREGKEEDPEPEDPCGHPGNDEGNTIGGVGGGGGGGTTGTARGEVPAGGVPADDAGTHPGDDNCNCG